MFFIVADIFGCFAVVVLLLFLFILGTPVARVVAGQRHTVFLSEVGEVLGCGNNDFGMLGLGDETQRRLPTKMKALDVGRAG